MSSLNPAEKSRLVSLKNSELSRLKKLEQGFLTVLNNIAFIKSVFEAEPLARAEATLYAERSELKAREDIVTQTGSRTLSPEQKEQIRVNYDKVFKKFFEYYLYRNQKEKFYTYSKYVSKEVKWIDYYKKKIQRNPQYFIHEISRVKNKYSNKIIGHSSASYIKWVETERWQKNKDARWHPDELSKEFLEKRRKEFIKSKIKKKVNQMNHYSDKYDKLVAYNFKLFVEMFSLFFAYLEYRIDSLDERVQSDVYKRYEKSFVVSADEHKKIFELFTTLKNLIINYFQGQVTEYISLRSAHPGDTDSGKTGGPHVITEARIMAARLLGSLLSQVKSKINEVSPYPKLIRTEADVIEKECKEWDDKLKELTSKYGNLEYTQDQMRAVQMYYKQAYSGSLKGKSLLIHYLNKFGRTNRAFGGVDTPFKYSAKSCFYRAAILGALRGYLKWLKKTSKPSKFKYLERNPPSKYNYQAIVDASQVLMLDIRPITYAVKVFMKSYTGFVDWCEKEGVDWQTLTNYTKKVLFLQSGADYSTRFKPDDPVGCAKKIFEYAHRSCYEPRTHEVYQHTSISGKKYYYLFKSLSEAKEFLLNEVYVNYLIKEQRFPNKEEMKIIKHKKYPAVYS